MIVPLQSVHSLYARGLLKDAILVLHWAKNFMGGGSSYQFGESYGSENRNMAFL